MYKDNKTEMLLTEVPRALRCFQPDVSLLLYISSKVAVGRGCVTKERGRTKRSNIGPQRNKGKLLGLLRTVAASPRKGSHLELFLYLHGRFGRLMWMRLFLPRRSPANTDTKNRARRSSTEFPYTVGDRLRELDGYRVGGNSRRWTQADGFVHEKPFATTSNNKNSKIRK